MKKLISILFLILILSACTTAPVKEQPQECIEASRIYGHSAPFSFSEQLAAKAMYGIDISNCQ